MQVYRLSIAEGRVFIVTSEEKKKTLARVSQFVRPNLELKWRCELPKGDIRTKGCLVSEKVNMTVLGYSVLESSTLWV